MPKKIPLTHGKFALVDDEDFDFLNQWKWYAAFDGFNYYAQRNIRISKNKRKMIRMHRFILRYTGKKSIDHINCNSLDNRKSNLRICTQSQNSGNILKRAKTFTGIKGVNKNGKKFRARICYNRKLIHLGTFDTIEKASDVYKNAAIKYFGEFARW